MADRDAPPGDELFLKDNGTIRIMLAGKGVTWRRPIFGEYRKFMEALGPIDEDVARMVKELADVTKESPSTPTQRLRLEIAKAEALGTWAIDVWRVLTEKEPPTLDDLPVWMVVNQFSQTIFEHWRAVPLAGSSSR